MKDLFVDKSNVLFLVDTSAYIHRAYHAIPMLTTSTGLPINAVYGFVRMILKLLRMFNPQYLGLCLDTEKPTFRHEIYKEYKSTRKKMDTELKLQIPIVEEFIGITKLNKIAVDGYEADDLISVISKKFSQLGYRIVIISGDKDILQIVNDRIYVYNEHKDIWYTMETVKEKYGIAPQYLVDYFALLGDSSDNISGVKGIGEKTAKKLIQEYNTIENLYDNIDKIRGNIKQKLLYDKENAFKSKHLITLADNISQIDNLDISSLSILSYDKVELIKFLSKYEMKTIIKEVTKDTKETDVLFNFSSNLNETLSEKKQIKDTIYILTDAELENVISKLNTSDEIIVSLLYSEDKIYGLAGTVPEVINFYFPVVEHRTYSYEGIKPLDYVKFTNFTEKLFLHPKGKIISYDFKNQLSRLKNYILLSKLNFFSRQYFDVQLAAYILNPTKKDYSLSSIVLEYFNQFDVTELKCSSKIDITSLPIEKLTERIFHTLDLIFQLYKVLSSYLQEKGLEELYYEVDLPLIKVVTKMELSGILVDEKYLSLLKTELEKLSLETRQKIFSYTEIEFNLNSPKQLGFILFEKLKLPVVKKKKTLYSTDEEVLNMLKNVHPVVPLLIEYREIEKLKNTYVVPFFSYINPETKRIHTTFNLTGTSTGRISSENPNLQNIPVRTEFGKKIRKMFVADNGYKLVSFDYSQIELRILAHFSKDSNLIRSFMDNEDIHTITACEIFNLKKEEVTSEIRRVAKVINFGIIYGITSQGLAKELQIDLTKAQEYITKYFSKYAEVKQWIEETINFVNQHKFTKTILNRIRFIPEINSTNPALRSFAERLAVNTPIQGSAADIIRLAMLRIDEYIEKNKLENSVKMLLQIHDELIFEIKEELISDIVPTIKDIMESITKLPKLSLSVPLVADVTIGERWGEN